MKNYLYILTSPVFKTPRFKVGITNAEKRNILDQYSRQLPDAFLILHLEVKDPNSMERTILRKFKDKRVKNGRGNRSEWIEAPFLDIASFMREILIEEDPELAETIYDMGKDLSEDEPKMSVFWSVANAISHIGKYMWNLL